MTISDFTAAKIQDLQERRQRLRELVRLMRDQHDRENRVEERYRLQPLIEEKEKDLEAVEDELIRLETRLAAAPAAAPAAAIVPGPPGLFYSYAHEDEDLRDELAKHLKLLERQGILSSWHDRAIEPGQDWNKEISQQLLAAKIILLLVSADFLASDYIWGHELKVALERHQKGEVRVVPILLRPCDWTTAPFAHLQALPRDARPITQWRSRDEAFASIAEALRQLAPSLPR